MKRTVIAIFAAIVFPLSACTGTPPTDGAVTRSQVASARALAVCLDDKGWVVTVRPDGSVSSEHHETQTQAYETALAECVSALGLDVPVQPLSDGDARRLYSLLLESAECLRAEGFATSEAPSEQAWVDAYFSDVPWNPYSELVIADLTDEDYLAYLEACPIPSVRAGR